MGAAHGVAVFHGFTSTPASMEPVAHALSAAGFTVDSPTLPGHGTHWEDLEVTAGPRLLRSATAAVDRLAARCTTVSAVGLSLGGTLALHAAAQRRLAGVVVINPGLRLNRGTGTAARLLRGVRRTVPTIAGDIARPGASEEAYPRTPVRAVAVLDRVFAHVRSELPQVRRRGTPVLLLRSGRDNVLPASSAEELIRAVPEPQLRQVPLPNSFHVATLDYDAGLVRESTAQFLCAAAGRSGHDMVG